MKGKKITTNNYFETIEQIGFENLPLVLKQSHTVIMTKTGNGRDWSKYNSDADLKRMINLTFEKLGELMQNNNDLSGTSYESDKHLAIDFIKEFLKMADGTIFKEDIDDFINKLQNAINAGKINKKSKFAKEINHLQGILINLFNNMGDSINVRLKPETRVMMESAIKKLYEKPKAKVEKQKAKPTDYLGEIPNEEELQGSNIMCSTDFTNLQFDSIGFKGKWLDFIGDPAPGFTAMVFGMPKMGKSYLCVDFAGYLARNHGRVLYVAKEEKLDATLQQKLKDKEVAHENLFVADALPADLTHYEFIFLDSVNKIGLSPKDLEKLKGNNKGKSFVYIFQATKGGKFKGNNEFQHDVDVVIEVPQQGKAVQFGRFNQGGKLNIFAEVYANNKEEIQVEKDLDVSENTSMLAGIKNSKMAQIKKTTKTPKVQEVDWSAPQHLNSSDRRDLKMVNELYEAGKMKEAMNYASRLETIVREEIPPNVWVAIGGELTPKGKEKLRTLSSDFSNRPDEINPKYLFSTTATALLVEALKGVFDMKQLARQELAKRGLNSEGDWVGFDQASKIHRIKK